MKFFRKRKIIKNTTLYISLNYFFIRKKKLNGIVFVIFIQVFNDENHLLKLNFEVC
jgi:hypothetical protein